MIFLVIMILLAIISFFAYQIFFEKPDYSTSTLDKTQNRLNISYDNFESEVSKLEIVNDLPSDSKILLRFYNFDSGEKTIEKSYKFTWANN